MTKALIQTMIVCVPTKFIVLIFRQINFLEDQMYNLLYI